MFYSIRNTNSVNDYSSIIRAWFCLITLLFASQSTFAAIVMAPGETRNFFACSPGDNGYLYVGSSPSKGTLSPGFAMTSIWYTYRANLGASGADTFTIYGNGFPCQGGTTNIIINRNPTSGNKNFSASEDEWSTYMTPSISDDVGNNHTVTITNGPTSGTTQVIGKQFRYKGNVDFSGSDSFRFKVCDNYGACSISYTASVTVNAVNDAPDVLNVVSISTGVNVWSDYASVAIGDVDSSAFTIEIVDPPANGITQISDSQIRYQSIAAWSGNDSFTYKVCDDASACSDVKTATVLANDVPVASDIAIIVDEDLWSAYEAPSITDAGDSGHTLSVMSAPANGTVEVLNGTVRYKGLIDWSGSDSFTFQVCDVFGECSGAQSANITVVNVNDPPIAEDIALVADEEVWSIPVNPTVTDNDSSVFTFEVMTPPVNATAEVSGPGLRFIGDIDWVGSETFTYRVCDDGGACSANYTATITANPLNDPPVVEISEIITDEEITSTPLMPVVNDPDEGDLYILSLQSDAVVGGHGFVAGNMIYFEPDVDWYGTTTFEIKACDAAGLCDVGLVNVTVNNVNDAPVVDPSSLTTLEDTASGYVDINFTDPDPADTHTLTILSDPLNGTVDVSGLTAQYMPRENFNGLDTFEVQICDSAGECATNIATVTIDPANDAPTDVELAFIVKQETQSNWITPVVLDPDDGDVFTLSILRNSSQVSAEVSTDQLSVRVLPSVGYFGETDFDVQVCDQSSACVSKTISAKVLKNHVHHTGAGNSAKIALVSGTSTPRDSSGEWPILSEQVLFGTGEGTPVDGLVDLSLEWSSDATASLIIPGHGLTLSPGQTASVVGYNMNDNNSQIQLPATFSSPETLMAGYQGTLKVSMADPVIPNVVIPVNAWSLLDAVMLTPSSDTIARSVEKVDVVPRLVEASECKNRIFIKGELDPLQYAIPVTCGIQIDTKPESLILEESHSFSQLSGKIAGTPGIIGIAWHPVMVQKNVSGIPEMLQSTESAETQITLIDPELPMISFRSTGSMASKTDWVPEGEWPTEIGDRVPAGYIESNSPYQGLVLNVLEPDGDLIERSGERDYLNYFVVTDIASVWDKRVYQVESYYPDLPELKVTKTITMTGLPDTPRIRLQVARDNHSYADSFVKGNLGLYNGKTGEFTYDSGTYGEWSVQAYLRNRQTGVESSVGASLPITEADGFFDINIGKIDAGTYMVLVKGTLTTEGGFAEDTLVSSPMFMMVADGAPIEGHMYVYRENGNVNFTAAPTLKLENYRRMRDVGEIVWESSTDGLTFASMGLEPGVRLGISEVMTDPGKRWYRARTINRHSGETFLSDVVELQAYRRPKVIISGYRSTFLNHDVTWTASIESEDAVEYTWTIKRSAYDDSPLILMGETINLPVDELGYRYVEVKAVPVDAIGITKAASVAKQMLKITVPYLRRPYVAGPLYVETGKSYEFKAYNSSIMSGGAETDLVRKGEWVLPGGSIVEGDVLNYVVKDGDDHVRYRTWIDGFDAKTTISMDKRFATWTYDWPDSWAAQIRYSAPFAPTILTFTVYTDPYGDIRGMGGEQPTYTYNLPPGVELLSQYKNRVTLKIIEPGDYPVEAIIEDSRGNSFLLSEILTAIDPPPLDILLVGYVGDIWKRAPSRIVGRMSLLNPVAGELMNEHRIFLDDVLIYSGRSTIVDIPEVTGVGTHVLRSEVDMNSGRNAIDEWSVDMIEGVPPVCTIVLKGNGETSLEALANCTVEMGRLSKFHWFYTDSISGVETDLGLLGSRINFTTTILSKGLDDIRIIVINDKGQTTEANIVP